MTTWLEPEQVDVPDDLKSIVGGHQVVANTLFRRGIKNPQDALSFLKPEFYKPAPPSDIPGMDDAVSRLINALEKNESVCVWGDFDVDGQTSTALLVSALRRLNMDTVFHVPLRNVESHGVNIPGLKKIIGDNAQPKINLLLTCDTGIASNEAIDFASQSGVEVIITDHHDLPAQLPKAEAILNPKMLPVGHALHNLPGVGVAFKLIEGLYKQIGIEDDTNLFLDLVALGIVSDVVSVTKDNRFLLQLGLETLRRAERPGLKALYDLIELNPNLISEEHIGFMIGPRLNAVGRLDNAAKGVELLITTKPSRARVLALELESLNARRKLLTNQVYQGVLIAIKKNPKLLDSSVVVISNPTWPAGIIGIVASKIVEKYHKPVILITTVEGIVGKGSARSIKGIDISAAIRENSKYLIKYGGHPMAAGLTIDPEKIEEFRNSISNYVNTLEITEKKEIEFDCIVDIGEISMDFIEDFERLAPFGPGNKQLIFKSENLVFQNYSTVGREDEHISITVSNMDNLKYKMIWWNGSEEFDKNLFEDSRFNLLYSARSSSFRGTKSIQLEWIDSQILEKNITELAPNKIWKIHDFRKIQYKLETLMKIEIDEETQIWIEAGGRSEFGMVGIDKNIEDVLVDRYSIRPASKLVIWTTPPGRWELRQVIERISPNEILLFCVNPRSLDFLSFIKQLIGMVKYGINSNNGIVDFQKIAVNLGQREVTVRKGLDWMIAMGYIVQGIEGTFEFASVSDLQKTGKSEVLQNQLELLLDETNAYRKYLNNIDIDILESGI